MRRFSLGGLMVVVALLAANLALLHYLLGRRTGGIPVRMALLVGLLPLANSLPIALWVFVSRWRVTLRRRPRGQGGGLAGWYAVACAPTIRLYGR